MKHFGKLVFAFALSAAVPANAQVELIYNAYLPPFNETRQIGIRDFSRAIEAESGGSIRIVIPDSSLAPPNRQYEMIRDGIADMAVVNMDNVSQLVTLNQIGELPGMAPTSEAGSIALWETYQRYFEPIGQFRGVRVLSTHVLPGRQLLSVTPTPHNSVESLRGARVWATSRPLISATEGLGAVPITTNFGELQEFVMRGNLDAVIITPGSADGAGILDRVTHYTQVPGGLGSIAFAIMISDEAWARLDAEQQSAVLRAAEGLPRRLGSANDASEREIEARVAQIPTTVLDGDVLAGFHSVLDRQIDGWITAATAAGIANPQEVLDFYRSVLERELAN